MVPQDTKTNAERPPTNQELATENAQLKAQVQWLKEQLGLAKHRLYAPTSEKSPVGQEAMLFNDAEANAAPEQPEPTTETITYSRRKFPGQRQLNLEGLPVKRGGDTRSPIKEIDYSLSTEEQICPQCCGMLHHMGEDVTEEIEIVPGMIWLVRHKRFKYACRHCQNHEIKAPIVTATMPTTAFPNSLASPSAVAHIMSQKFVEGLPLYRQEASFLRMGFVLSRQTMANWMLTGATWLEKVYARLKFYLLLRAILHADETTLQVLKEEGRAAQTESYLWLYRSGRDGPPIVLFEYQPTRAREHPFKFLTGFCGYLHVDGYQGYEKLPGIMLVGCWAQSGNERRICSPAHARRKFVEAVNTLPPPERKKGKTHAHIGLAYCNELFRIERDLADLTPEERFAARQARSQPVLDKLRVWLDAMEPMVLPKSKLGEAITYCLNQWSKLQGFLLDGRLELDNNRSERSIKPFVIGRLCGRPHNLPYVAQFIMWHRFQTSS